MAAALAFVLSLGLLQLPGLGAGESAQAQEVSAWVDKSTATLEDQIILTVSLSGFRRFEEIPELPPLPEFSISKGGTTSRTQIVNGKFTSSVDHTFLLTPNRAGTFTIGPIRVQLRGESYHSRPIQVRILPAESAAGELPAVFITQEVDVTNPFVQQQVVYSFRFLQKVQAMEAQWEAPAFSGFWVEDLGRERRYDTILGGERYSVTEIKKALFATSEGVLEIPESALTCKVFAATRGATGSRNRLEDDFFSPFFGRGAQAVTKTLRAKPIRLQVRPLPMAGRPEGFQGLVGQFSVKAAVGETKLRTGDSTTLTLTVSGQGNLRDLVSIPPEQIPGFKIYPDKPSFELAAQGDTIGTTRVFKKALVPLETGAMEIPGVRLPYFDPAQAAYRSADTSPIVLTVNKGEQSESLNPVQPSLPAGGKTSIQVLGKDILPIHTGLAGAGRHLPSRNSLGFLTAAALLPPGVYLVLFGVKRRKEQLAGDPRLVRRKGAGKKAARELKAAKRGLAGLEEREFFSLLSRSLKGLIGDKLNLSALAYTPAEVRRCLEQQNLGKETIERAHRFLEELEFRQYASSRGEVGDREAMHRKAGELLSLLDRNL